MKTGQPVLNTQSSSHPAVLKRKLRLSGDEGDHQRVQRQRFNQHQSENECEPEARLCSWIASRRFASGSSQLALAQSTKTGRDAHREIRERQLQISASSAARGRLREN